MPNYKKNKLSHIDNRGKAKMVDISTKDSTLRNAKASCKIFLNDIAFNLVKENNSTKGDVLGVARIAGIIAAKKTSDLIPLCHQVNLSKIDIDFILNEKYSSILVKANTVTTDRTGIEMEALVATSITSLTIYDMLKAVDKEIKITDIVLDFKDGGRSGKFVRTKP